MPNEYALPAKKPKFPQVEPESSYWFRCPVLSIVSFKDVEKRINERVEPYPMRNDELKKEILELRDDFYLRRLDDFPQKDLSVFLKDKKYTERPPVGSAVSEPKDDRNFIHTGLELATLFENETPGLWHRHVLNVLFDPSIDKGLGQQLSPPLQSLVWAALDVAIARAMMTAWHYKWLATRLDGVARRQRPIEYVKDVGGIEDFEVLYDFEVEFRGGIIFREKKKGAPQPSPGTPRHPAYPSGHSTYSVAASTVLECFFSQQKDSNGKLFEGEFDKLARNIGEARLWGGVHWRSDDDIGREIGSVVGELVNEQLTNSGIYELLDGDFDLKKLSREKLESDAKNFAEDCGENPGDFCQGLPKEEQVFQNLQG